MTIISMIDTEGDTISLWIYSIVCSIAAVFGMCRSVNNRKIKSRGTLPLELMRTEWKSKVLLLLRVEDVVLVFVLVAFDGTVDFSVK